MTSIIKTYLQLVRFPGVFTAFTNVFLGFFLVYEDSIEWFSLGPLIITTGFLFFGGMAINDYFDYKIDKIERPERPLPSGKISKKMALFSGFAFLAVANLSSSIVGVQSLIISLIMTGFILLYDFKSKNVPILGEVNLSFIRFLNVILGSTVVSLYLEISWYAIPIAIFVSGISVLARTETRLPLEKTKILNFILILITISYTMIITFDETKFEHIIFLGIFTISVFIPYHIYKESTSRNIQKKVTYQLLAIILLDATLISAFSENFYAVLTSVLYIPALIIAHKMYLT